MIRLILELLKLGLSNILDIPTAPLVHVSQYLPKTSCLFLAVVRTASTLSWQARGNLGKPCKESQAILDEQRKWITLDTRDLFHELGEQQHGGLAEMILLQFFCALAQRER